MDETDNLDDIAQQIFTKPPLPPYTVGLQLEEMTAEIAEREGAQTFIFNVLLCLTVKGMEILYGHRDMHLLKEEQYLTLCKYVLSFGYHLAVYGNDTMETPWELARGGMELRRYRITFDDKK
jgi:hypothetical protein